MLSGWQKPLLAFGVDVSSTLELCCFPCLPAWVLCNGSKHSIVLDQESY